MQIELTKNQIYIALIVAISLVMFANKSLYLMRTGFTEGVVIKRTTENTPKNYGGTSSFQLVDFEVNNTKVRFSTSKYANYKIGEKVKVIYLKSDITNAKIFSFSEYWFPGFTRGLFVFIILSGIVYAFIRRNEVIVFNFKSKRFISMHTKESTNRNKHFQKPGFDNNTPRISNNPN